MVLWSSSFKSRQMRVGNPGRSPKRRYSVSTSFPFSKHRNIMAAECSSRISTSPTTYRSLVSISCGMLIPPPALPSSATHSSTPAFNMTASRSSPFVQSIFNVKTTPFSQPAGTATGRPRHFAPQNPGPGANPPPFPVSDLIPGCQPGINPAAITRINPDELFRITPP